MANVRAAEGDSPTLNKQVEPTDAREATIFHHLFADHGR